MAENAKCGGARRSPVQVFYFGSDALLRRHHYDAEVLGDTPAAHYVHEYDKVSGIMVPTRRRVLGWAHFTDKELVDLTVAVIAINAWNRLAVTFRPAVGNNNPAGATTAASV